MKRKGSKTGLHLVKSELAASLLHQYIVSVKRLFITKVLVFKLVIITQSVGVNMQVSPCCTLACPLWKKWKASEALGFTCFTTGKIFRMSSSVKAGLWRLSKLYSFIRIYKANDKMIYIKSRGNIIMVIW